MILDLEESGEMEELKKKWFVDTCQHADTTTISKFSLYLFTMPLLMLAGVACLSGLFMSCEMLASRIQNANTDKSKQRKQQIELEKAET